MVVLDFFATHQIGEEVHDHRRLELAGVSHFLTLRRSERSEFPVADAGENTGSNRTLSARLRSTASEIDPQRIASVKVGKCRLCCSQSAMGARTTVLSRSSLATSGQVISLSFMRAFPRVVTFRRPPQRSPFMVERLRAVLRLSMPC